MVVLSGWVASKNLDASRGHRPDADSFEVFNATSREANKSTNNMQSCGLKRQHTWEQQASQSIPVAQRGNTAKADKKHAPR
eukprot:11656662-Karenia_brevis.AAC.1